LLLTLEKLFARWTDESGFGQMSSLIEERSGVFEVIPNLLKKKFTQWFMTQTS